ncbi:MAG: Fic family protein [Clostridiales bacterium]|jgi:Fic family protein|nr:Fic family protein [Clostridiales bacterium]
MTELLFKPKYEINDEMLTLVANIASKMTSIADLGTMDRHPPLRNSNRIKAIHGSLAIENSKLLLWQVEGLRDGKMILADPEDITEAKNCIAAYDRLFELNPYDVMDFLTAHQILMKDLLWVPGQFRTRNVGVVSGKEIVYLAPPPDSVSGMMADLFRWIEEANVHPLIKSVIFHYEVEFIHPFLDGNGRMGRMWETRLLGNWNNVFAWLPVEAMINERRDEYYEALQTSQNSEDCTAFLLYMLQAIWETMNKYSEYDEPDSDDDMDPVFIRANKLVDVLGPQSMFVEEIMEGLKLKSKQSFKKNYLEPALRLGLIEMTMPQYPTIRDQRYRRKWQKG